MHKTRKSIAIATFILFCCFSLIVSLEGHQGSAGIGLHQVDTDFFPLHYSTSDDPPGVEWMKTFGIK